MSWGIYLPGSRHFPPFFFFRFSLFPPLSLSLSLRISSLSVSLSLSLFPVLSIFMFPSLSVLLSFYPHLYLSFLLSMSLRPSPDPPSFSLLCPPTPPFYFFPVSSLASFLPVRPPPLWFRVRSVSFSLCLLPLFYPWLSLCSSFSTFPPHSFRPSPRRTVFTHGMVTGGGMTPLLHFPLYHVETRSVERWGFLSP